MIPQAAVAMLACARIGAVHTVVFGGFASEQLAIRIGHSKPVVILTASCGVEPAKLISYKPLLDAAIDKSPWKPKSVVVFQRPGLEKSSLEPGRDFDWQALVSSATPFRHCEPMLSTDPLYMLYTSGTTGTPKAILRDTGGYCVALNWSLKNVFNLQPADVMFTASDVGWVVGHSYIVYGPLIRGLTSVLYEGKPLTPDPGAFWRVISEHRANAFFTAPTAFRTIKREDPDALYLKKHDMSSLKSIWVAGEHADPNTIEWLQHNFPGIPIVDNAWQTETGWPITANPLGIEEHPVKPGSSCRTLPGYNLQVLTDDGSQCAPGVLGNLAIKLPLPPGTLPTLFNNDVAYKKGYLERFPGYYNTGDAGLIDSDGYVYFMTRTDDIINVSGVRLSTGAIEEVISDHPAVAECAVVGPRDPLRGQIPIGLVVLKSNSANKNKEDVIKEIIEMVRSRVGAVAYFRTCVVVSHLPKTRSGKILRKTIKSMADGDEYTVPGTIDNPAVLDIVKESLLELGFPKLSTDGSRPQQPL
jgi:propionyl-CoA synthetase